MNRMINLIENTPPLQNRKIFYFHRLDEIFRREETYSNQKASIILKKYIREINQYARKKNISFTKSERMKAESEILREYNQYIT